jgi:predicted RNase H-like HicB family nuclease
MLTGATAMRRYEIVIEDAGSNLAAYVPDLPGCAATGEFLEEVNRLIREAIELHLEGLEEDGLSVPPTVEPRGVCRR